MFLRLCAIELLILALLIGRPAVAQESSQDSSQQVVGQESDLIERVLDRADQEELDALDRILWLQEHPFNLNEASKEELQTIPGVLPQEAVALTQLRKSLGSFSTIDQVKILPEIGDDLYKRIKMFVRVDAERTDRQNMFQLRSRAIRDLQPRQGFLDSSFAGSSLKTYHRAIYGFHRDVEIGALFEKDAGETTHDGFTAGYGMIRNVLFLDQIIVGDYALEIGQGLALWRASAFGKSAEAVDIMRAGVGATPYRSTDEFNFFRGAAAFFRTNIPDGTLTFNGFVSRHAVDGTLQPDGSISSFYDVGLFRTENERAKKNVARETLVGATAKYSSRNEWSLGFAAYTSVFDHGILGERLGELNGTRLTVFSLDGDIHLGRMTLFGETATSGDGAVAAIFGLVLRAGRRTDIAVLYRDFNPRYVALHANAFDDNGHTNNERGMYGGIRQRIFDWLKVSGFVDLFAHPWVTFTNPFPTSGKDILLQVEAQPIRPLRLTARINLQQEERASNEQDAFGRRIAVSEAETRDRLRVTASYQITQSWRLKGRIETSNIHGTLGTENGILLFYDVRFQASGSWFAEARVLFFDTDSFDSRIYEYENDLRGVFSNQALFGKGRRWYLLAGVSLLSPLQLTAKYSQTEKEGVTSLSSGPSLIRGSIDTRFSLQLDLRF